MCIDSCDVCCRDGGVVHWCMRGPLLYNMLAAITRIIRTGSCDVCCSDGGVVQWCLCG